MVDKNPVKPSLPRLPQRANNPEEERRRDVRWPSSLLATLRTRQGAQYSVHLADVSMNGCCIAIPTDTDTLALRNGAFVSILLESDLPVDAIIRWIRKDMAGLEFLRAISTDREAWVSLLDHGSLG